MKHSLLTKLLFLLTKKNLSLVCVTDFDIMLPKIKFSYSKEISIMKAKYEKKYELTLKIAHRIFYRGSII